MGIRPRRRHGPLLLPKQVVRPGDGKVADPRPDRLRGGGDSLQLLRFAANLEIRLKRPNGLRFSILPPVSCFLC